MRIAFFGTPEVAVPSLEALAGADGIDVAAVVTNPDRPRGRRGSPQPPPVKEAAGRRGLPVWQPAKPVEVVDDLVALDLDACAVVAYGALLPATVLATARLGFVNLHFSLLPRWRGAAPVQHAIRAGDTVTGITTFVLDEGMDTGPILTRVEVPIEPDESAGALMARLARRGAPVLVDSLRRLAAGERPRPQPADGATMAPKIRPEEVEIDWTQPAGRVADLVRSADPSPGAHTWLRGARLKVFRAVPLSPDGVFRAGGPGEIVAVDRDGPVVACGAGAVALREVQPEGKRRIDGAALVNGYRLDVGERLGDGASP